MHRVNCFPIAISYYRVSYDCLSCCRIIVYDIIVDGCTRKAMYGVRVFVVCRVNHARVQITQVIKDPLLMGARHRALRVCCPIHKHKTYGRRFCSTHVENKPKQTTTASSRCSKPAKCNKSISAASARSDCDASTSRATSCLTSPCGHPYSSRRFDF